MCYDLAVALGYNLDATKAMPPSYGIQALWDAAYPSRCFMTSGDGSYFDLNVNIEHPGAACNCDQVCLCWAAKSLYTEADVTALAEDSCSTDTATTTTTVADYVMVSEGTCESSGFSGIKSQEECGAVAIAMGLSDTTPTVFTASNIAPFGCVWKYRPNKGNHRLKWEGDEFHAKFTASDTYTLICATQQSP
jgi:hypothetical protein